MDTDFTVFWVEKYYGYSPGWIAVVAASVIILLFGKWLHARYGGYLIGYSGLFFVIYFFPVTAYIIANWCIEKLVYWRLLWLFPGTILVGYAAGLLYGKCKKGIWKFNAVLFVCLIVIMTGTCIYGWDDYEFVKNPYKIPQKVIDACDIILENSARERPLAVGDYDFSCYSRLYNANILQPYGRYTANSTTADELRQEFFNGEGADIQNIIENSLALDVEFIVFYPEISTEIFQQNGYMAVGGTEEYTVYQKFDTYY